MNAFEILQTCDAYLSVREPAFLRFIVELQNRNGIWKVQAFCEMPIKNSCKCKLIVQLDQEICGNFCGGQSKYLLKLG